MRTMARKATPMLAALIATGALAAADARANDGVMRLAQAPASGQRGGAGKAATPPAQAAAGEPQLRQRVEQLEEQLVDMQVTLGTLETLARSGGGGSAVSARPIGGGGASDAARLDGIETQIRALTAQLEQLAAEVRGQRGGIDRRGDLRGVTDPGLSRQALSEPTVGDAIGGFGATTVTPGGGADPIGSIISSGGGPEGPGAGPHPPPPLVPAGVGSGADSRQLYETAYGYLLQQDYGAAQAAFEEFLQRFPSDRLAGNAQYWLGESHFVRGDYKTAAGAFLKGYQTYGESPKAPDSLLKLAVSLDRLGQKDAACSSFAELNTRFPAAPSNIKNRAQSERRRVGCP